MSIIERRAVIGGGLVVLAAVGAATRAAAYMKDQDAGVSELVKSGLLKPE